MLVRLLMAMIQNVKNRSTENAHYIQLNEINENTLIILPNPIQKKHETVKTNFFRELTQVNHPSFRHRSVAAWTHLVSSNPKYQEKIEAFTNAHSEKIVLIKEESW